MSNMQDDDALLQKENEGLMRVIIAGGRDVQRDLAEILVRKAIQESGWEDQITEVVHGAAPGIDSAAHEVCRDKWPVKPVPADWKKHGKSAGPIRNRQMAGMADGLIAIWDGRSRGTKNMIETAERMGLKVFVMRYGEQDGMER